MRYFCDAPDDKTWFRLITEAEAVEESRLMNHAVEKYFRREQDKAEAAYRPASSVFIEQDIGKADHVLRSMPLFLTLRDQDGRALATAMLPASGQDPSSFRCIIVGPGNADPYDHYADAIRALAEHVGFRLDRAHCYPYRRD
jgi:hypothetical protein